MKYTKEKETKTNLNFKLLIAILIKIGISIIIPILLLKFNIWPQGNDIWGHLFKAEFLLDEIKNDNFFPIISPYWYNGIELFRYWPPLTYYIIAMISFLFHIEIITSSTIFLGFCIFLSLTSFLFIGKRENKIIASLCIGIAYIFMPHNIEVVLFEGNIPRIFISSLLPLVFFLLTEIIQYKKKYAYPLIILTFVIVTYSHIMISAMLGISIFLYSLAYAINNREWKTPIFAITSVLISYLLTIPILLPALTGGGLVSQESLSSIETINQWSQNALISLNPMTTQNKELFYYGLMFFIICLLGLITYRKDTLHGFVITTLIFLGTTESFLPIVKHMPFSQALWMRRFVPMAYAIGLLTIIQWKKLKPYFVYIFVILFLFDGGLRLTPYIQNKELTPIEQEEMNAKELLIDKGIALTNNRFAFLDLSSTSSYSSYKIYETKTKSAFGWSYQGAATMQDIMKINEAFEYGYYGYSFSRLITLGCDSVNVKKNCFSNMDIEKVKEFATLCGYEVIEENEHSILFDLKDVDFEYGTKTNYKNLAIGDTAYYISYLYPNFGLANSNYIDDYSFEELTKYEKLYLSGFEYHNKTNAENLLKDIANKSNTKIYIDTDSFKLNKTTGQKEFLGIYVQAIDFNENFPIITLKGIPDFLLNMKTKDYDTWKTSYIINVPNEIGISYYGDKELTYLGTDTTTNINYIGYNLVYYNIVGDNKGSLDYWLDATFKEESKNMPITTFHKIKTTYDKNTINVVVEDDNVHTNIAWNSSFKNNEKAIKSGNFLELSKGEYTFPIYWPFLPLSMVLTINGILLCILFLHQIMKEQKKEIEITIEK